MRFAETRLPGAYVISLEKREDPRGFFARAWCADEFRAHGLETGIVQCNLSHNAEAGILRGLHYQLPPAAETKAIRCIRGAIYDVIVDLRRESPTYMEWFGIELTADNGDLVYVPKGFAHGFQALVPDSEASYQATAPFTPEAERGVRWDDPAFGIEWPIGDPILSDKDAAWPDYEHSRAVVGADLVPSRR